MLRAPVGLRAMLPLHGPARERGAETHTRCGNHASRRHRLPVAASTNNDSPNKGGSGCATAIIRSKRQHKGSEEQAHTCGRFPPGSCGGNCACPGVHLMADDHHLGLSTVEGLAHLADRLRHQTLHGDETAAHTESMRHAVTAWRRLLAVPPLVHTPTDHTQSMPLPGPGSTAAQREQQMVPSLTVSPTMLLTSSLTKSD